MEKGEVGHTPRPLVFDEDNQGHPGRACFGIYEEGWDGRSVAYIPTEYRDEAIRFVEACNAYASNQALIGKLVGALEAFSKGFQDGSIKWARPRQSDSDPYHPANTLMCAALEEAAALSLANGKGGR